MNCMLEPVFFVGFGDNSRLARNDNKHLKSNLRVDRFSIDCIFS